MAGTGRRRGLVLEGGGAKGSYAFGCLLAFKERGVKFDAVSGTSVGALNGLLWATDSIEKERRLWEELTERTVFERTGHKILLYILLLYGFHRSFLEGLEHSFNREKIELVSKIIYFMGDFVAFIFFVYVMGYLSYYYRFMGFHKLYSINSTILFLCVILYIVIVFNSYKIFDERKPKYRIFFILFGFFVLSISIYSVYGIDNIPFSLYFWAGASGAILLFYVGHAVASRVVYFRKGPLVDLVSRVLDAGIKMPLYVTYAETRDVYDPDRPNWNIVRGRSGKTYSFLPVKRYFPVYRAVQDSDNQLALSAIIASAALPFGITKSVEIEGVQYVDGGVADNCPVYPLVVCESCSEIVVVRLSDERFQEGCVQKYLAETERGERVMEFQPAETSWQTSYIQGHNIYFTKPYVDADPPKRLPWKDFSTKELKVLELEPQIDLGDLSSGTLNFSAEYAMANIQKGYEKALSFIDEHGLADLH